MPQIDLTTKRLVWHEEPLGKELHGLGVKQAFICSARHSPYPFSYSIAEQEGQWITNIDHLTSQPDTRTHKAALDRCQQHFDEVIGRSVEPVRLQNAMIEIADDLARAAGASRKIICAMLERIGPTEVQKVRELAYLETRSGNMITHGGHGFPWPFIFLLVRQENGWEYDRYRRIRLDMTDAPPAEIHPTLAMAETAAQSHFNETIGALVESPLLHQIKQAFLDVAHLGLDTFEVFAERYPATLIAPRAPSALSPQ